MLGGLLLNRAVAGMPRPASYALDEEIDRPYESLERARGSMSKETFFHKVMTDKGLRRRVFKALDEDMDGKLDAEPFERYAGRFERNEEDEETQDGDGDYRGDSQDDSISEEAMQVVGGDETEGAEVADQELPSDLELMKAAVAAGDRDRDSMMDKQEFFAQMSTNTKMRAAIFRALDIDKDGKLDAEPFLHTKPRVEIPSLEARHTTMRKSEFTARMKRDASLRAAVFSALDSDGDGQLDAEPFEAVSAHKKRAAMDFEAEAEEEEEDEY